MKPEDENAIVIPALKPKDPIAKDLHTAKYHQRVVKPKKGKGAFKRTKKDDEADELSSQ